MADDVSDLPPAFVVTAEYDPLRDEGEAYGAKLAAAGVPVEVLRAEGMFHGFFGMGELIPSVKPITEQAFAAVRRVGRLTRARRRDRRAVGRVAFRSRRPPERYAHSFGAPATT